MRLVVVALLAGLGIPCFGFAQVVENPARPIVDAATNDLTLGSTSNAAFAYGNQVYRIWESIYNRQDKPRLWQFRYEAQFKPEVKKDGTLNITTHELLRGYPGMFACNSRYLNGIAFLAVS